LYRLYLENHNCDLKNFTISIGSYSDLDH